MAKETMIANCPICSRCREPIFKSGIIVRGNVDVVDVSAPAGNGGGFVGNNFPSRSDLFSEADVGSSPFHWTCFRDLAAESIYEIDMRIDAHFRRR